MSGPVKLARERGLPIHVHCTLQSPDLVDRGILAWDSQGAFPMPLSGWDSNPEGPKPVMVVVQGDTRTAFQVAVDSYERGIPLMHVEAGVRTYDLSAPWPEEGYRQMISRIAKWHACTTWHNANNLCCESTDGTTKAHGVGPILRNVDIGPYGYATTAIHRGYVRVTGSPIVESVRERAANERIFPGFEFLKPILVTLHRRENRGHFNAILEGVLADRLQFGVGVFPYWTSHPNGWAAQENTTDLKPNTPLAPHHFAEALRKATLVVTDSGGVQEEANALGVPCVVARTVTDRPESLGKGGAILGGNTRESISAAIQEALKLDRSQIDPTIFGDGKASERICDWWGEILQSSH